MLELLQYRAWLLSEVYLGQMYGPFFDALASGHNLIKKKTIEDFYPRIEGLISVSDEFGHPPIDADVDIHFGRDEVSRLPVAKTGNKSIALIPIIGPLTKYGDLCSPGMQDYQALLNRANSSPTIDGIVLIMDTPGGTVDGTPEFGLAIKSSAKPVGVFGDSMVASAGMWLASQASVIIGNKNNPTEFGSIGVFMMNQDWSKQMEVGFRPRYEIIRAPQSTEKALINPIEPVPSSARKAAEEDLRLTANAFIDTVKAGRGDKLDTKAEGLFAGRMFGVYDAKKNGLIDGVGTLQTAVNKVAELARQKQKGSNANSNIMKFPKLSSLFGGRSKEAKEVNLKVTSEGLQSDDEASTTTAETKVAEMEAENGRLKAESEEKDKKITSLEKTVSEQSAQITALEGDKTKLTEENAKQKAELEKKPTGSATTVVADPKKESNQTNDPDKVGSPKSFRSQADDESDKYVAAAGYATNASKQ